MATDDRVQCKTEPKSESKYDPRIDFFSDQFDPVLALQTPNLKVPEEKARQYDNIAMYKSARRKKESGEPKQTSGTLQVVSTSGLSSNATRGRDDRDDDKSGLRRWLPHQYLILHHHNLPVAGQKKKPGKNIFKTMTTKKGPLDLLTKCYENNLKVKVWIRHCHGIRGFCTGYVSLFDKHFNMVLEEVTEVWTRLKKRKVPAFDSVAKKPIKHIENVIIPEIRIVASTNKTETCSRFVEQFVIRGEHVALIAVLTDESADCTNIQIKKSEVNK